jgi:hypothetical protein
VFGAAAQTAQWSGSWYPSETQSIRRRRSPLILLLRLPRNFLPLSRISEILTATGQQLRPKFLKIHPD